MAVNKKHKVPALARSRQAKASPERNGERPAPLTEIGLTGLRQWHGQIDEEFLTELKWEKAVKVFREMGDNDATIASALNAITWLIRQVEWSVEGEDPDAEDERAELIEQCMQDMTHSWEDLLAEVARGTLQYGWQVHEIVYKVRDEKSSKFPDGKIGWKRLPVRAQDTLFKWDFDDKQDLKAFVQRPAPDFKERRIPISKLLLFRTESIKDNPQGKSLLRTAYRSWYFKRNLENIEGIGVERDLAGLPVMYAPARLFQSSASEDVAILDELKRIVTNVKRDEQEGVLLPMVYDEKGNQLYKLELLSTAGQRQMDTNAIISRYDLRILQIMLADFIQIGHEKVGSFALSSNKTELFAVAIGCFLDQIASVFNRFAIPRLLEVNGMETEDAPELKHGDIESRDLGELADYLSKLATTGMPLFPNPKLEGELLRMAKLPVPTPEEMAIRDAEIEAQQERELEMQTELAVAGKPPAGEEKPEAKKPAPKDDA